MSKYILGPGIEIDAVAPQTNTDTAPAAGIGMTLPVHTAQTDEIRNQRDAAAFLQKATFGPTIAEIDALVAMGSKRAWMLDQMGRTMKKRYMDIGYVDLGVTNLSTFDANTQTDTTICTGLFQDSAALRAKATWALSKLFVVSWPNAFDEAGQLYNFAAWYDRLDKHAFGNWRDLIESVTYSLQMSRMLTYYANIKEEGTAQPDENYAREIMQLFSIGLWELNPDGSEKLDQAGNRIPTYGNDDIRQLARCLTGLTRWDFNGSNSEFYDSTSTVSRNKALSQFTTQAGPHHFGDPDMRLKHYLPFYEYGAKHALGGRLDIPEGTDPVTNLAMMHDALFMHPNTPVFFAKRMIQHFVTSNPSPSYIARVARAFEDNGQGARGDLKAVWMAILTSPEAAADGRFEPDFGRVRDSFDLFANLMRSMDRKNNVGLSTIYFSDSAYGSYSSQFGPTGPRLQPSIFGAYDPTHTPAELAARKLLAPEMQAWSDTIVVSGFSRLISIIANNELRDPNTAHAQISDYSMFPLTGTPEELTERINLLMMGGKMSPGLRAAIIAITTPISTATVTGQQNRLGAALQVASNSPDYWVQM